MSMKTAVLALAVGLSLVACKKQDDAAAAAASSGAAAASEAAAASAQPAAAEATPVAEAATPAVAIFDINTIPASDKPLPAWPYVSLPAGYQFYYTEDLPSRTKDLARVPLWTGGQLLWLEGKVFSDAIDNVDGKTYSKFEVRKNVQQAIEGLGGVRLAEHSLDEATFKANESALDDFRGEFDRIGDAYWYGNDADTYLVRRADKAIWIVFHSSNSRGGLMVAEGPLPEAPAKQ